MRRRFADTFWSLMVALTLLGCVFSRHGRAEEIIRISSMTSLQKSILNRIAEPFRRETGIRLEYGTASRKTSAYFKDLLDGKVDAALAAVAYEDWVKVLKEEAGIEVPPSAGITHRVIGRDALTVYAHRDVGVKELSAEALRSLFTGKARSWKAVGGPDLPVVVVYNQSKPAIEKVFRKMVTGDEALAPGAIAVSSPEELAGKLGATPGSLGYEGVPLKSPRIIALKTPPIGRPATLLTRGRPSAAVDKLIGFIRANPKLLEGP